MPLPVLVNVDGEGRAIISGENPDWDEYRERMRSEKRVLIRIALERAGPDRQG
jgi:hypothetical protein